MSLATSYGMKKRNKCAHGGYAGSCGECYAKGGAVHETTTKKGVSRAGSLLRTAEKYAPHMEKAKGAAMDDAKKLHKKTLEELKSMKAPDLKAEGGDITVDEPEDDIVNRILQQRYSKGGQVANETEELAGFAPNEFDDLVLRDDLESSYTGENSGDYIGNEGEDDRREDIVSRILRSLRKRPGHNPNPA
jgi:hypothetical protein